MKKLRVIHWGTGHTGTMGLKCVLQHPEIELVGLCVYNPAKVGKDAGEFCGLPPVGIKATDDIDKLVALEAGAVCFMAGDPFLSDPRFPGSRAASNLELICRLLRSGKNVCSTSSVCLVYPYALGPEVVEKLESACREGNSRFHTTGIDPGFMGDVLMLTMTRMCRRVDKVHCYEILNYGPINEPDTIEACGFGRHPSEFAGHDAGSGGGGLELAWSPVIHMVADGLGVKIDEIRITHDAALTEMDVECRVKKIPKGTIGALRFQIAGIVAGQPRIVFEHVNRIHEHVAPDWPKVDPDGYRLVIEGDPPFRVDVGMRSVLDANLGTAAHVVNALPVLCRAGEPGIKTFLNMPPVMARGLMAT